MACAGAPSTPPASREPLHICSGSANVFYNSLPVKTADRLFTQEQARVEQKAKRFDLHMHFNIDITVGVGLLFPGALSMVVVVLHCSQMFGRFAFLAQTIIYAYENLK